MRLLTSMSRLAGSQLRGAAGGTSTTADKLLVPQRLYNLWCREWDSNPHSRRKEILSLSCIPISPPRHRRLFTATSV